MNATSHKSRLLSRPKTQLHHLEGPQQAQNTNAQLPGPPTPLKTRDDESGFVMISSAGTASRRLGNTRVLIGLGLLAGLAVVVGGFWSGSALAALLGV